MFIASRNQVDKDELGVGYVMAGPKRLAADIKKEADNVDFKVLLLSFSWIMVVHCRVMNERNAHLPVEEAMELAKKIHT
ncbi:hypothetical protein S101258_00980 [Lactiplantibacillus plantarum subsp. plantarum]|uniref:Uncharacterized protein n=1 Tax=Lactiplantibacillus plantarum subsp. plantarum TaxID=337330 RepID=A0A2S3U7N1_LACPN|nr:hypothetical protein S101258_00980 [Lactiplantibacillus plantarum subsp. plantarum]